MKAWLTTLALALKLRDGCGPYEPFFIDPTDGSVPSGGTTLAAPVVPEQEPPAPPPISGGSVLVSKNSAFVIIGDADRDRIWVVNAEAFTLRHEIALQPHDEPGRLAEDSAGIIHVVLRGAQSVVSINPATGAIVARRSVCPLPRGIAYDRYMHALHVVCGSGEFITIPDGGVPVLRRNLQQDLRDIVVRENGFVVSTFRSSNIFFLDRLLSNDYRMNLTRWSNPRGNTVTAIWRMIEGADGAVLVTAQSTSLTPNSRLQTNYVSSEQSVNSSCLGMINTVLLRVVPEREPDLLHRSRTLPLPVDIVENGGQRWIVSAANRGDPVEPSIDSFAPVAKVNANMCAVVRANVPSGYTFTGGARFGSEMVFFSREPAALARTDGTVLRFTSAPSVRHTGHELFHRNFSSTTGVTCASCHLEGGDDGQAWNFPTGTLRTISLRGTFASMGPYNWGGEFTTLDELMADVFVSRSLGPRLQHNHVLRLSAWLEALPPYPNGTISAQEAAARARGEALFQSPALNCASCHAGPKLTNQQTMDVGSEGAFQVPSLIGLRYRAPYLHNGCATTLAVRFTNANCGGTNHGGYGLSQTQLTDLMVYLNSL